MPVFRYEAINSAGRTSIGKYQTDLIQEVEQWLVQQGLTPINIELLTTDDSKPGLTTMLESQPGLLEKLQGVSLEDRILLCRQLSTMLEAGVTILQSLEIMAGQVGNGVLRRILAETAAAIEGGSGLSDALAGYPRVFNQLFLNVVMVGEESGSLDRSFLYLATLYENEKDINERIKAATRYPKIVISAIFLAVFVLMSFVVPKFAQMFATAKVALPMPTRILIAVSGFFSSYYLAIIILVIAMAFLWHLALNYEIVVETRDRLILKTPVVGELSIKIYMSRFCRVFAVLTTSGINIIKTLELSTTALGNLVLVKALRQVTADVESGMELQLAMRKFTIFPPMVIQMVTVGEESGQLDKMMNKVADYFESETNYTIKNLSTLIEPFLLLFLGVMVAFIALSIFLPMWNIMSVMRH